MKYLESAIKDAVEKGGYFPSYNFDSYSFGMEGSIGMNKREITGILLDPAFWSALGKARGWDEIDSKMWLYRWHDLIDFIASGGDIEGYFKTLV